VAQEILHPTQLVVRFATDCDLNLEAFGRDRGNEGPMDEGTRALRTSSTFAWVGGVGATGTWDTERATGGR
jgi:hypothetical protein